MIEKLEMRVYGDASLPTLVYLPGLHGDWTLIGGFRRAVGGRVRFVEMTYPRTLTWSLEDYAAGVEQALVENSISRGWLVGESFGSQVLWPLVARGKFRVEGVVLAGGFGRHPMRWGVRLCERICGGLPLGLITGVLFGYARLVRRRHRHQPEVLAAIDEFIARRTELDRAAAKHRLRLIAQNDPCSIAAQVGVPVFGITGMYDAVVPWFWARRWLKENCPALQEYRIIRQADHTVLNTASRRAADQILSWMTEARFAPETQISQGGPTLPRGEPAS